MPASRPLTDGEWRGLSSGFADALRASGAAPLIVSMAHPGARIARLWRGGPAPVLTRFDKIHWPKAPADLSAAASPATMGVLQHELQHVLDYRTRRMTTMRYALSPSEWKYDFELEDIGDFERLGAEQRASVVEALWLSENGYRPRSQIAALRASIPWA